LVVVFGSMGTFSHFFSLLPLSQILPLRELCCQLLIDVAAWSPAECPESGQQRIRLGYLSSSP
jgi:hypothetical protein